MILGSESSPSSFSLRIKNLKGLAQKFWLNQHVEHMRCGIGVDSEGVYIPFFHIPDVVFHVDFKAYDFAQTSVGVGFLNTHRACRVPCHRDGKGVAQLERCCPVQGPFVGASLRELVVVSCTFAFHHAGDAQNVK